MTPRELGPYLLLRKLSENALCEAYRAGQRSGQEVERVVLLYFFNSTPDDALWISETAQAGRRALAGLESPSLSAAIDSGEIAGSAYLTYDYISGRSLETVLEKARRLETAIPIEHALLITDRVAQGLQAAWEHESRALHGFVVPHLVMLSNEGDVQVLGLEVASRLRKLLADDGVHEQMGRYLAPEVVPEGQPSTTDDVFSLGAILYELVTGQQLPADSDSVADAVAEAQTPDGEDLPAQITDLLETSVATSFGRSDLKTWRSKLSALLSSGEYDGNAFNLALFLHTLFGDEIESEAEEALGEGTMLGIGEVDVPAEPTELRVETGEDDDAHESGALEDTGDLPGALVGELPVSGSGRGRALGIAAGILLVLAVGFGAFKFFGPSEGAPQVAQESSEPTALAAPAASQQLGSPVPGTDAGSQPEAVQPEELSPEEIDRRVQELLSQRSADMESSLRQEFESELATLRQQLEEAQSEAETPADLVAEEATVDEPLSESQAEALHLASTAGLEELPNSGQAVPATFSSDQPGIPESSTGSRPEVLADDEPAEDTVEAPTLEERTGVESTDLLALEAREPNTDTEGASSGLAEETSETMNPDPEPSAVDSQQLAPTTDSAPAVDTAPQVQQGDLVAPGPGVTLPRIVSPAQPVYPMLARRLKKSAMVTVKVLVDEDGRVLEAERLGEEAGYGFDNAAVQAALKTRFEPPTKDGVLVKMWWTVRIAFQP